MEYYEEYHPEKDSIARLIKELLPLLGETTDREGLIKTPYRVAKALKFLTSGYAEDPEKILNGAIYKESYNEMVLVKNIEFYSLCEHHLLPFYGKIHIGYIPKDYIVGLSKLPRLAEVYSRRLQVQERLTTQIHDAIQKYLKPQGVAVVIEAVHLCMMIRGVEKQSSSTTTSALSGPFLENPNTRMEFMNHVLSRNLSV